MEMFKCASDGLLDCLLAFFNEILLTGQLEEHWLNTVFTMLPKAGDRALPGNWRPIAILPVTYKIFSKMLHQRLHKCLEEAQTDDQIGFRSNRNIEEAFLVLECICSKAFE